MKTHSKSCRERRTFTRRKLKNLFICAFHQRYYTCLMPASDCRAEGSVEQWIYRHFRKKFASAEHEDKSERFVVGNDGRVKDTRWKKQRPCHRVNCAFLLTNRSSGKVLFAAINFNRRVVSMGKTNSCKIHLKLPQAVRMPGGGLESKFYEIYPFAMPRQ